MKNVIFAVCDPEAAYAFGFTDYVNRMKNFPFPVQAFTGEESLLRYAEAGRIELLLIAETVFGRRIRELDVGQILLLSENRECSVEEEYPRVFKYQSSEVIVREVLDFYASGKERPEITGIQKKEMRLLGVYSPVGRCGKTSFALTLGQILAREQAVLYLNLEPCAGFPELTGAEGEDTLSDLLYYVRLREKRLAYRISGGKQSLGNLDYLPPAELPEDLFQVTEEEWSYLLDTLRCQTPYETVIVDFGEGIQGLFSLLHMCGTVFVPVLPGRAAESKLWHMERAIRKAGRDQLLDKMQRIQLPPAEPGREEVPVETLVWREMGDFVRHLLGKEAECRERSLPY